MNYTIKRGDQQYGPYSLAELQRYVASGNVLLTDLCRSEGMPDWVPVSQVIGTIPVPAAAPAPASVAPGVVYPDPPSLHWGLVLLFAFLTCGIFTWVWMFVQASWMKKVQPASKAMMYYGIAIGLYAVGIVLSVSSSVTTNGQPNPLGGLLNLAAAVVFIVGAFSLKSSIEDHYNNAERIGLQLSGVMTFFFSTLYFQYHFTQIIEMKKRQGMALGARI